MNADEDNAALAQVKKENFNHGWARIGSTLLTAGGTDKNDKLSLNLRLSACICGFHE
jgi:hypothetical protein